jgi:hypothetical protein
MAFQVQMMLVRSVYKCEDLPQCLRIWMIMNTAGLAMIAGFCPDSVSESDCGVILDKPPRL